MSSKMNVDRNLLFAVIALQDDLIDQRQFADVCAGWATHLDRPLADLLIERKWITDTDRSDVERKLERKLKKNDGDVRATLGRVAEIEAREVLQAIENPQVRHSIHALPPPPCAATSWWKRSCARPPSATRCDTQSRDCMRKGVWARSGSPAILI